MADIDSPGFWSRVEKSDGCWEWQGVIGPKGYGRFFTGSRTWRAHRLAWFLERGPIPDGQLVCHRCDNPRCVRIDHLFLGTNADNMADMVAKGRSRRGKGGGPGNPKLTAEQVLEARRRHPREPYRALAREYGVSFETIRDAIRGFTWKGLNHLEPPGTGLEKAS